MFILILHLKKEEVKKCFKLKRDGKISVYRSKTKDIKLNQPKRPINVKKKGDKIKVKLEKKTENEEAIAWSTFDLRILYTFCTRVKYFVFDMKKKGLQHF